MSRWGVTRWGRLPAGGPSSAASVRVHQSLSHPQNPAMAEEPQSAIAKASAFIRKYVIPLAITVIMYLIGLFWGLVVVFRIVNRYRGDIGKVFVVKKRPLPPKILDDPELGNHCYIQLPNIKLHYVESGDKSKPLLILLHGFPEFWYCWRHQIKEFSKDYWVVAVDLRGYGDSEKPPSVKYYSMKYLSEDVKNLIEGLGRQKAILVAHDWGGIAAWSTVLRYPEMIEKFVILNAPHPVAFNKHLVSSLKQFLQSWYMFFFQLPFLPELFLRADDLRLFALFFKSKKRTSVLNEEELEAYKFTYGKPGATFGPLAYYRANILGRYRYSKESDKKKATPSSDLPKGFLLFGDEDVALDVKLVELSKAAYPNLETEIIPGACHFVQEDEPVIVNAKIREFLES